jgi:hypothetical protein
METKMKLRIFAIIVALLAPVSAYADPTLSMMGTAVELAGFGDCTPIARHFIGAQDGTTIYIVTCRGGDRFIYADLPGKQVSIVSCAQSNVC